jgi:hypothetical protein
MNIGIFLVNWINNELDSKTSAAVAYEKRLASSCHPVCFCLHGVHGSLVEAPNTLFFLWQ